MNKLPSEIGQPARRYEAWEESVKELIECEMVRRGITYKQLSRMLEELGVLESPDQINRKVIRKHFSAAFLFACLEAMNVESVSVKEMRSHAA